MGAHFSALVQRHFSTSQLLALVKKYSLREKLAGLVAFFRSLWLVRVARRTAAAVNAAIPWPPEVSTMRRAVPYVLFFALGPKLAVDAWTLTRKAPDCVVDVEERDRKLRLALARCLKCGESFLQKHAQGLLPFPEGGLHATQLDTIALCVQDFLQRAGQSEALKVIASPRAREQAQAHQAEENEVEAVAQSDGEDFDSSIFAMDSDVVDALRNGEYMDTADRLDQVLAALHGNIDVLTDKLFDPSGFGALHPLALLRDDAMQMLTLVDDFFKNVHSDVLSFKTEHGSARKWTCGKPLRQLHRYSRYQVTRFYSTVPPREVAALAPADSRPRKATWEHWTTWRKINHSIAFDRWKKHEKCWHEALVGSLVMAEDAYDLREQVTLKLKRSKLRDFFNAARLIVGTYTNWAMILAQYVIVAGEGMLAGAVLHYRSLLLTTAQKVAATAAKTRGGSGANNISLASGGTAVSSSIRMLMDVVVAILITEISIVVLKDMRTRVEALGLEAMRKRLQKLLAQRLLAQDLETFEENQKSGRGRHVTSPQSLLSSFPLQQFLQLPTDTLRVVFSAATTAHLLWSKNSVLFFAVLVLLEGKSYFLNWLHRLKSYIFYRFVYIGLDVENNGHSIDIFQALKNFRDVRENGNEHFHLDQMDNQNSVDQFQQDRDRAWNGMWDTLFNVSNEIPTLVIYVLGAAMIMRGRLAPSDLVLFPSSVQSLLRRGRSVYHSFAAVTNLDNSNVQRLDSIVEVLNEEPTIGIVGGDIPESGKLQDSSVEFKDVEFRRASWPINQQGITFKIPAGSFVAVCGKNGVGKSTLFKLLLRLYDPDAGDIFVGGRSIKEYNPVWLRSSAVAMAAQKPGMYRGTLRDNICYGSEQKWKEMKASDAEIDAAIEQVLRRSGTLEMFQDRKVFSKGFDTRKRPSQMSGGQTRGVGLARALLRETPILLLDEPTNDLDPDRQQAVKASLIAHRPKGQTILCITHELSTIRDADHILFFSRDKASGVTSITAKGTYDELIVSSEVFRRWHDFKFGAHADKSVDRESIEDKPVEGNGKDHRGSKSGTGFQHSDQIDWQEKKRIMKGTLAQRRRSKNAKTLSPQHSPRLGALFSVDNLESSLEHMRDQELLRLRATLAREMQERHRANTSHPWSTLLGVSPATWAGDRFSQSRAWRQMRDSDAVQDFDDTAHTPVLEDPLVQGESVTASNGEALFDLNNDDWLSCPVPHRALTAAPRLFRQTTV